MPVIDPVKISDLLVECSDRYILPRYNALVEGEISTKTGPNDLVTQADLDVEEHLKRVLPDMLPGSIVIGEEGVSSGEVSLDLLDDRTRPIWIVDPVDGTYNFVHGKREFGVMLGLIIDGEAQHGWIYDVLGETTALAERGAGAFYGDVRLDVKDIKAPQDMGGHINPRYFPSEYRDHIAQKREEFAHCSSIGCAAHEYLRIARGEAQFSIYSRLKPWDHIPGSLLVREAGGVVKKWDGGDYAPDDIHTGIIAASSDETAKSVQAIFMP